MHATIIETMVSDGIAKIALNSNNERKGRFKKKCKYNWPELDTYCGCCSLSTGIYIRTAINLVVTALTIVWNSNMLIHIMGINPIVFSANAASEDYLEVRGSNVQQDLATLHMMYNGFVIYYILYLCYKCIYILILFWTIFAIFKRSGKMIKILLFVSVPNFILDIFISSLAGLILRLSMRMVLLLGILSEFYNILALSSEYKKIMGKLRVRHKDIEHERGTPSMPSVINPPYGDQRYGYDQVHCRGCNCTINGPPDNGNGVVSLQPSENSMQTTLITYKEIDENELNYALTGILNPRNTDEYIINETAGSASGPHAVRPNTLDLAANVVQDEKGIITDEPIIYDVNQLNVGTSPVIEDEEREV